MTVDTSLAARQAAAHGKQRSRPRAYVERSQRTAALVAAAAVAGPRRRAELLDEIIVINRVIATSVAARYRGRGIEQDDLDQVALEGLTKAVHRFDLHSDNDLLTYAVPTIRGELQRYFRDLGWVVRPPRRIQELQREISSATTELSQRLGHDPEPRQIAELLGITVDEYADAMAAQGCFQPTSLDLPVTPGGQAVLGDLLSVLDPETATAEARTVLGPVVRRLPARDRKILYLRFFEDLTQAEIGERIGVTQMQVSRLLTGILARLRSELEGNAAQAS